MTNNKDNDTQTFALVSIQKTSFQKFEDSYLRERKQ